MEMVLTRNLYFAMCYATGCPYQHSFPRADVLLPMRPKCRSSEFSHARRSELSTDFNIATRTLAVIITVRV